MREMVLLAQRWMPVAYRGLAGSGPYAEDRQAGWQIGNSLTNAVHYKFGIIAFVGTFGAEMPAALKPRFPSAVLAGVLHSGSINGSMSPIHQYPDLHLHGERRFFW